jgi:hypothetical protein
LLPSSFSQNVREKDRDLEEEEEGQGNKEE